MKIEQKRLSNLHTFSFEPERLNFSYRDKSGSGDIDVSYADIPNKSSTLIDQNTWLRNVGYLWCVLGLFQIGFAFAGGRPLTGTGFWLLMGAGCLLWARFTRMQYTIFSTGKGRIWVIQDGALHDQIIDELRSRRKSQLLAWFGDLNLENGPEKEVAKFRWLVDQQVLTEEEAQARIAQVHAALGALALPASSTTN